MARTQVLKSSIKLPKSFESIQSLVESAYKQKDESEFFKLLCESIIVFIADVSSSMTIESEMARRRGRIRK